MTVSTSNPTKLVHSKATKNFDDDLFPVNERYQ